MSLKKITILFTFIVIFISEIKATFIPNEYFEVNSVEFTGLQPCQVQPDSQSSILLLSTLFPNLLQSQRITFTIFTQFFGYNSYDYTLFSMHQQDLVISLDYNLAYNKIFLKINGVAQETLSSMVILSSNIAIDLDIQLQNLIIQAQLQIQQPSNTPFQQVPFQQPFSGSLMINQLQINYGNPPKNLGVYASCQLITLLSIGVANLASPYTYTFNQISSYLRQGKTKLEYNYDFFYTQSNPYELVSDKGEKLQKIQIKDQSNTITNNGNSIQTAFLDAFNQMTLSFYIKFNELPTSTVDYLCIRLNQFYQYLLIGNNQFQLDSSSQIINQNVMIWNHIVIMKESYLYLFVNYNQQASSNFNSPFQRALYEFYSHGSSYQVSHIRFYSGALVQKTQSCFLQSLDGSCILCMQNYLLDFQNQMQCVSKGAFNSDNEITGVKDWNPPRKICPQNMISDNSSPDGCKCLLGFYFDGNQCIKCPQFCRYCNSLQDCYQNRDSKANCSNQNAFDDGQNCILPLFIIPQRKNIRRVLNKPDFGQICAVSDPNSDNFILTQEQLNIIPGDTIFISFSLLAKQIQNVQSDIILAAIKENQQILLKITISSQIVNYFQILFIRYYVQDQFQQQYIFHQNDLAWIALWTDGQKYIFMFRTNQHNYYNEQVGSISFLTTSNIEICVGKCDNYSQLCLSLTQFPITFIKNIPYPTEEAINQFFTIYQDDFPQIGRYKLDMSQTVPINYIIDTSGQPSQPQLQFSSPLQVFNQMQGFQLTSNIIASLTYTSNLYTDLYTISFNIEFCDSFIFIQFVLLRIVSSNNLFQIDLIPDYTKQIMLLQVMYANKSIILRNSVLLFGQSNFFMLTARVETKQLRYVSTTTCYFEIVCNYIKETLEYIVIPQNIISQVIIGYPQNQYKLFLDNINIFQQNTFVYYEYTKTDPCFIYVNLANMKCLYLKKGYLFYNNQIITYQQCSQMAQTASLISFVNLKDQTCNLKTPQDPTDQLCALMQYQNGMLICIMCKDKNADPQQKCLICKKQYFFNSLTHNCQLCDAQCVACSGQSNNCTECLYINQITPNCDCIQFKQTQQNTCQCNNNCLSCSGIDSNFCFTCTSDKREPPACKCSPNYKEIQNECVEIKITCDPQCTQCSKASNYCTSCSQNRVNPPICQCQEGYEGIQDGSCQPCQLGTYYDFEIRSCRPCGYEQQFNKSQYNQQDCLKDLNVIKFSSFQQNQQYFLMFTFDKNLKNFNVTQFQLFKIVQFYIPEVSNNTYSIINPLYNGNTFQVQLKVKNNFRADYIFAIIINNTYFLSQDTQYILGQKYLNTQMKAKIGPFIFLEDILDNQKLDSVSNYLGEFKSSNQNIFSIINQLQFLFYVLNTLQPVSVFLLLDLIYPPQLYKFYQIIGIFVFPSVPDYLNEIPKRKFYLFNYELEGIDAEQPHFGKLKNLGFNLSIIQCVSKNQNFSNLNFEF
ncbi:hypothetical protein ABPG74_019190 [Tetrahymena malaccensis]